MSDVRDGIAEYQTVRVTVPEALAAALAGTGSGAQAGTSFLLISLRGMAHFLRCPHKGDDPDLSNWGNLDVPQAWHRLGNGEHLHVTGGERDDLIATSRCQSCLDHGPW